MIGDTVMYYTLELAIERTLIKKKVIDVHNIVDVKKKVIDVHNIVDVPRREEDRLGDGRDGRRTYVNILKGKA